MALRLDNVGIVVEDLALAIEFFRELGLELEGRGLVEGEWAGRVTGLGDQRVEIAMMRTPDGHGRLELSRFLAPRVVADHRNAPVNKMRTELQALLRRQEPPALRSAELGASAGLIGAGLAGWHRLIDPSPH